MGTGAGLTDTESLSSPEVLLVGLEEEGDLVQNPPIVIFGTVRIQKRLSITIIAIVDRTD